MTDDRFDDLTKLVSKSTSRRGLLKGAAAVALGGLAARVRGNGGDAAARARVSMACARLGQPCATGTGTPGNMICCPHLICGDGDVCCKDTNETCVADSDCCADNVCRPNPTGLGNRCLPPGGLGAECQADADCAGGLVCDPATNTCLAVPGEPCADDTDCVSGLCDEYTGTCISDCLSDGSGCSESSDCCSGYCDPYTLSCVAAAGDGSICVLDEQCASGYCASDNTCATLVSPSNEDDWIESIRGTGPSITYVSGPSTPPLGTGSVQFAIGADGDNEARLSTTLFTGMLLSDFSEITYWAYVQQNVDSQAPYLRLQLDRDGDGLVEDQLFFEPAYQNTTYIKPGMPDQGAITLNTWQQWNALDGCWWSNNGYAGLNPGSGCNSIAVYLASFPNATIITDNTIGSFRIDTGNGGGSWDNFIGNVDDLEVAVGGVCWVFDFEATP
jgi:hypothetical protein